MNRLFWEFDKEQQILKDNENACQFSFQLSRQKSVTTYEEKLVIVCYDNGKENGTVISNLINIEKDIKQFLKYGVALGNTVYTDIVQAIKDHYLEIKTVEISDNVTIVDDRVIDGIVQLVKEYASEVCEANDKELHFTSKEFEDFLSDSEYEAYNAMEIRKQLAEKKYTLVKGGRTTKLIRENGKTIRVVCFDLEKVRKA